MGSISFQVVGDADVGTQTKTYAVPDAHVDRLVAWAQAAFQRSGESPLTVQQALLRWSQAMMDQTRQAVVSHERNVMAIAPFEAT